MATYSRFEEFRYCHESGELFKQSESGETSCQRLPPQPCRLLDLLLENYPDVVSRDQIQKTVWPEVAVDFERSLHFCVRQIRSALGDQANDPRFIETIPRRGYRWIAEIEANEEPSTGISKETPSGNDEGNDSGSVHRGPSSCQAPANANHHQADNTFFVDTGWNLRRFAGWSLVVVVLLTGWKWFGPRQSVGDTQRPQIRIAVMPFEPSEPNEFTGNDIAIRMVEKLTNHENESFEVIGPTTTSVFEPNNLRTAIEEYKIDWVLNGKFSNPDGRSRLLAEVIRASDGTHLWVNYFEPGVESGKICDDVCDGLFKILKQEKD